jgi:DNA sulfur modification protein DndB
VSDIIFDHFKKLHGDKYWNQIGTPQMRVKAYERQQSDELDKQLDIEAYLDFIDKKKIIEKQENWEIFKKYFNIPFPEEKGQAKNLRWMDRLNELRRVVAHSHKRSFTSGDLDFLEWIKQEFEKRLLAS